MLIDVTISAVIVLVSVLIGYSLAVLNRPNKYDKIDNVYPTFDAVKDHLDHKVSTIKYDKKKGSNL
jgi:archaellum component FlaF (FlaF/FlaG flagellin family)